MPSPDQLAVCSWSLKPADAADLIDKARAVGVTRVQLHLDPLVDGADGWADAGGRLADAGIEVVSGMGGGVGEDYGSIDAIRRTGGIVPDETWPATRRRLAGCAEVAGRLGLKLVTFHAGFIPHDPADPLRGKVMARLSEVADLFAAEGCAVGLETGQESAEALLDLLQTLGRDGEGGVGVNFDPANMILYGSGDPVAALRLLMPFVRQVHLKDAVASAAPGREWGTEVPVGSGEVDWDGFFAVLNEHGYRGDLCVEREAGDDRQVDVRTAVALVRGRRSATA